MRNAEIFPEKVERLHIGSYSSREASKVSTELSIRVLLAEDDEVIVTGLVQFLEDAGCTVVAVTDGSAALEAASREDFDVIVCDIHLPSMDGDQIFAQLNARGVSVARRMIFTTGDDVQGGAFRAEREAGCVMLQKPFRAGTLLAAVQTVAMRSLSQQDEGRRTRS